MKIKSEKDVEKIEPLVPRYVGNLIFRRVALLSTSNKPNPEADKYYRRDYDKDRVLFNEDYERLCIGDEDWSWAPYYYVTSFLESGEDDDEYRYISFLFLRHKKLGVSKKDIYAIINEEISKLSKVELFLGGLDE